MTAPTTYEIGTTLAGCATLDSLGLVNPESTFIDYSTIAELANGLDRGLGFAQTEWHYGYLTLAQLDILKTFCAGVSASVFIATLNNDMDYKRYSAKMKMPIQYAIRSPEGKKVYIDVTIRFTHMVAAE